MEIQQLSAATCTNAYNKHPSGLCMRSRRHMSVTVLGMQLQPSNPDRYLSIKRPLNRFPSGEELSFDDCHRASHTHTDMLISNMGGKVLHKVSKHSNLSRNKVSM